VTTTALVWTSIPYVLSLAAVIGTFYGIIHTNKVSIRLQSDRLEAEERKQNRDLLRAKGEELYILIDEFERDFREASSAVANHYYTKPNQPKGDAGDYNSSNSKFQRIDMLTNVYFPSAVPAFQALKTKRDRMASVAGEMMMGVVTIQEIPIGDVVLSVGADVQEHSRQLQKAIMSFLSTLHSDLHE
jgi:hypothetical protein